MRDRRAVRCVAGALVAAAALSVPAHGQAPTQATVTRVIDGNSVQATLSGGGSVAVRLIGTEAPAADQPLVPDECGGKEATRALRDLVEGQAVSLTSDPSQEPVDFYGRSLFYLDRADGLDAGRELIRRGWAHALWPEARPPQRLDAYLDAEIAADSRGAGVWGRCDGSFELSLVDQRRQSAKAFVQLYYRRISSRRFLGAWHMLGARRKAQLRSYRRWKAGQRQLLGVAVLSAQPHLSEPRRVFVSVRLRSRHRELCGSRVVRQHFRGDVVLADRRGSWVILEFRIRKTGGKTPRLSKPEC